MSIKKWLLDNNATQEEYNVARGLLMTGPRSQAPTFRAIKKMIGRLRRGDKPGTGGFGWSSWRDSPKLVFEGDVV